MEGTQHPVAAVRLVFLARLRDALGRQDETYPLDRPISVGALLEALRARGGPWERELAAGRAYKVAVNHEVVAAGAVVRPGDEVAVFPPVTGG